ncbi:MAG: hypothetical protein EOO06_17025 [Chitinophagaceae bacterium]|nr:MAG: hypothetical protein EOO06_17025 [Chitinophagaceae bacterium]
MQLVLVLKDIGIEESIKDFHLYKYRQDVKLVNFVDDNQCAALFGAAYGCIYLPAVTALDYTGLNALATGTPLISLRMDSTVGMFGEASLYTELEEKEIAEQMMLLYKDEALRKILIGKGTDLTASYSWEEAALRIWECITTSALPDKS